MWRTLSASEGVLHTALGRLVLRVHVADSFLTRFRGLMLAPPLPADEGLLLVRCASVHTAFLRGAIDLVYLEASGFVVRCVPRLEPWRLSAGGAAAGLRSRHVLELAAGSVERCGVRPGDRLEHALFQPRPRQRAR